MKLMGNGMNSLHPLDDRMREAQYGRFASNVLRVLRDAVDRRVQEGETKSSLAAKLGWNRSQLSRLLNGNVGNVTIKSISDILWAARFEPEDFEAMANEEISPNYVEVMHVAPRQTSTSAVVMMGSDAPKSGSVAPASASVGRQSRLWVGA